MKRELLSLAAAFSLFACRSEPQAPLAKAPAVAAPVSTSDAASAVAPEVERMAWWREARFGMFIHWGLYAIPAGKWGAATGHGEWIRTTAQIPLAEYEKFQAQFNPVKFDADAWAKAAADAGMKYLVITSKHHDGFCLFDSAETDWDVMNTPFQRDILKELSEACARRGVRFCTYHSIMDWHHPDYTPRREWEKERSSDGADFARFRKYLHAQVSEVITKYHPGVLWFDGEWESTWTHEQGVELYNLCRSLDPALIVNNRVDVHRGGMGGFSASSDAVGDYGTPEQEIPATGMPGVDWETCMTMNDHWGFNAYDDKWKSSRETIRMLVDIASKGGNYLLNVGPKADGTFPAEASERLAAMGAWMKRNGDAVYGTSASPFDVVSWGRVTTKARADGKTTLYLHVFDKPASNELRLPGLGNEFGGAGFLHGPRIALPVRREGSDVIVTLAQDLPDADCTVLTLTIDGAPIVYRAPVIESAADEFVSGTTVEIARASAGLDVRYTLDGGEPSATSTRYEHALALTTTTTVRARGFHRGKPVTETVERTLTKVAPRPAVDASQAQPGLRRERFAGDWDALPDFSSAVALDSSVVASIAPVAREEHVGCRFSGFVEAPRDEVYVFALACDDGGKLWIDGELVVDNDGLHGTVERRGHIALASGRHALRVDWFNKTGGAELSVKAAPLGTPLAALDPTVLSHLP